MERIQSRPTDALSYNQNEPKYWDRAALDQEIERVFDICAGCRLCFNLCPSFPELFGALDSGDGDVRSLSAAHKQRVIDLCYGCKLCEVRCPYTPHDGHEFQLDFPRLMLRARAVEGREQGIGMREKMLGNPDRLGKIGSIVPKLANWACRSPFQRAMMEKMLGISRAKQLPEFAGETFDAWLAAHRNSGRAGRARGQGRDLSYLLRQLLQSGARARAGLGARPQSMRDGVAGAELLRDAGAGRRRRRFCAKARARQRRLDAAAGAPGLSRRRDQSDLLADDARGISGAARYRRRARTGCGGRRPARAALCAPARGQIRPRLSHHAGQGRLSRAVSSQGPEHRPAFARSHPIDPGRGGRDGGRLHGARRHLGDEEGVFRAVDEVGRRRPSPE